MSDVFEVADILVSHAVEAHGKEIGIIAYYGSYATGTATLRSDLDIYYVPDDMERTRTLSCSFILDGRPYDFWPISWQRLERIARVEEHWPVSVGLIANARILYSRSGEDLKRFNALKDQISELRKPEKRPDMVKKSLENYKMVLNGLGKLRLEAKKGTFPGVRWAGWEIVISAIECLALANQVYFSKGWGSNHEEVLGLGEKPDNLEELIEAITTSDNVDAILAASEELSHKTREILVVAQRQASKARTAKSVFEDFYPVIHEYVNKIVSACEEQRPVAANYAAAKIQNELSVMLSQAVAGFEPGDFNLYSEYYRVYEAQQFPNIMDAIAPERCAKLIENARKFDDTARDFLMKASLNLNILENVDHLKRFLEERNPVG